MPVFLKKRKTDKTHNKFIEWVFDMSYSMKYTALILPLDVFTELLDMVCLEVWLLL